MHRLCGPGVPSQLLSNKGNDIVSTGHGYGIVSYGLHAQYLLNCNYVNHSSQLCYACFISVKCDLQYGDLTKNSTNSTSEEISSTSKYVLFSSLIT